jgi:hypothetical protein
MDTDTDRLGGDDCEHNHGARNSIGFVSSVSGFQSTGSLSQPNRGGQRGEVILRSRCRNSARVLLLHVRSCMVHVKKKVSQKKHNVKDSTNACMSWCFFFLLGAVALSVVGIQAMFSCQPTAMKFGTEARPDSPGSMRPTPNNWTAAGGLGAYFRRTWPIKEAGSPLCCILFTVYNREFISTS